MVSVDFRTRCDADVRSLDFVEFHERELPEVLQGPNAEFVARALAILQLPPLALQVDGHSYTYRPSPKGLEIIPGDTHATAVASLGRDAFSDLMQDVRSTVALIIGDDVKMLRGSQQAFIEWEPVFRAARDGRPVYEPGSIDFRARDGSPLDLTCSFAPQDPPDEMAHFLRAAGFLRIRGLFTADEMNRISGDIDRAVPHYRPNDGRSWWARTRAGEHRPVRLQYFQVHSERVAALLNDRRFLAIAGLTSDGHACREGNAIEALVKPIGVVEGISDVTWHKDCSLGRHSYQCCGITVGISVTKSDEESGQLCVVAGSHRASLPLKGLRDDLDLPRIGLPTAPGDVTVHLSCTYHMSIPPQRAERRVMYTGFALPARAEDSPEQRERLRQIRERAPAKALELKQTSIGKDPEADRRRGFDRRGLR
ncbi:MAG TPA: phytanoyl-CoA dioxygenase family protein [Candidatus Acidoferrales bacterium]|nr:phytanoyl-CoA dioxygenase family protein [Candidatus Acidoferrales bacterium]